MGPSTVGIFLFLSQFQNKSEDLLDPVEFSISEHTFSIDAYKHKEVSHSKVLADIKKT